jgi:hypothetical protein
MEIQVINVDEGTPVRVMVARINQIDDPDTDYAYDATGRQPGEQPGLEGLEVNAEGRVVQSDGALPEIMFLNYQDHWKYDGNNFYCFYLAFGERGGYMVASERDYENHEEACLHMRFTVFIHRPATNLPAYTRYANRLYRFFRNDTAYFRAYLMSGPPDTLQDWYDHYQHRYIVIFLGHGGCRCEHDDHPRNSRGDLHPLYDRAFDPDQNRCPPEIYDTDEARAAVALEEQRDRNKPAYRNWPADEPLYAGCGHKTHVEHSACLEKLDSNKVAFFFNVAGREERNGLLLLERDGANLPVSTRLTVPRFCFYNGACRSMLTTNLGEHFTQNPSENKTRYYHGWVYSPSCDYGRFCYDIFSRWLQGTDDDPAPPAPSTTRFMDAYRWAANQGNRAAWNPRIMDAIGRTTLHLAPMAAEEAMS